MKNYIICLFALTTFFTASSQDMIFRLDYNFAWPAGDITDFIEEPSFRGGGLGFDKFINDNVALGVSIDWIGFYEKKPRQVYKFEGGAIDAVTFRYFYQTAVVANFQYYPIKEAPVLPYIGVNVGTTYITQEVTASVISIVETSWNFAYSPEIGIHLPFGSSGMGLNVMGRYNFSTYDKFNMENADFISLGVGLSFLMDQYY